MISPQIEPMVLAAIHDKSRELDCTVLAANTCDDHVHVAVNIPPKQAVSEWVRTVKGRASRDVNNLFPDLPERFGWQDSYGVLTFGAKQQGFVVSYIERQKEHHAQNTIEAYLERTDA